MKISFKLLFGMTIFLSIIDYYIAGIPLKVYYFPPLLLILFVVLRGHAFHFSANKLVIVLLAIYLAIIINSYVESELNGLYGIKSPLIFFIGIVTNIAFFLIFYTLFDIRYYPFMIRILVVSIILNASCAFMMGIIGNIFHIRLGNMFSVVNSSYLRPAGFYAEPDIFGFYVSSIALLIFPLLVTKNKFAKTQWMTICFFAYTALNVLSITRTTILSQIICTLYFLIVKRKWKKIFIVLSLIMIVFLLISMIAQNNVLLGRFSKKFDTADSGAFNSRMYNFYMTIDYIKGNLLFGSGPGYLDDISREEENMHKYASGGVINNNRNGSFFVLGELFNTGIIGTCIMIILIILTWRTLSRKVYNSYYQNILFGIQMLFLNAIIVSMNLRLINFNLLYFYYPLNDHRDENVGLMSFVIH